MGKSAPFLSALVQAQAQLRQRFQTASQILHLKTTRMLPEKCCCARNCCRGRWFVSHITNTQPHRISVRLSQSSSLLVGAVTPTPAVSHAWVNPNIIEDASIPSHWSVRNMICRRDCSLAYRSSPRKNESPRRRLTFPNEAFQIDFESGYRILEGKVVKHFWMNLA